MSGYQSVLSLRRLEEDLNELGLMLCNPKHGSWSNDQFGDRASVKPKDTEALPVYTRDAELYSGTLEQIRVWILGVNWARNYDGMLNLSSEKKRKKKECDYRHTELLRTLKQEETATHEQ